MIFGLESYFNEANDLRIATEPFEQNSAQAPISGTTPTDPRRPTCRRPHPATETGARASGPWCVVRDPGCIVPGIVCVRPCLSVAFPAMAGLWDGSDYADLGA